MTIRTSKGAKMPRGDKESIKKFKLRLPPPAEQNAITDILGAFDDKIEQNRRMNETLEVAARAIFKDWFIDFGPTRAKMEGREPYLPPEIWNLFPDTLDEHGKPMGWEFSPLGDHIEILNSKRIPLSSRDRKECQGIYPYHGATGVMDHVDDFLFDGVHILVGEDGSVIKPSGKPFTQYVWGKFWVNNHAHVLQGKNISNEMLLCFLQQLDVAPYITGAVQPKLNQKNLKAIQFLPFHRDLALVFDRLVIPIFEQFRNKSDECLMLSSARDSFLSRMLHEDTRFANSNLLLV